MSRTQTANLLLAASMTAILMLYLPWGWHQNASLSPNQHDLAEWITLSPQAQAQNPPLLGSLLLRGSAALLAILIGMQVAQSDTQRSLKTTALGLAAALGLALTLIPPLDFVSDPGNLNSRQQLLAAIAALVGILGSLIAGNRVSARLWSALGLLLALGAALLAVFGLLLARDLFLALGVSLALGGGALGFIGLECLQVGLYGWRLFSPAQRA